MQDPLAAAEIAQNRPEIYSRLLASADEESPIVQTIYQWDQNA